MTDIRENAEKALHKFKGEGTTFCQKTDGGGRSITEPATVQKIIDSISQSFRDFQRFAHKTVSTTLNIPRCSLRYACKPGNLRQGHSLWIAAPLPLLYVFNQPIDYFGQSESYQHYAEHCKKIIHNSIDNGF